ncbi:hypothetical protein D3C75_687650 [compost metagenome]
MTLNEQIDIITDSFPHNSDTFKGVVQFLVRDGHKCFAKRVPLQSLESAFQRFLGFNTKVLHTRCSGKPPIGIHLYLLMNLASQQPMNRDPQRFAVDVPQRHLHCAKRRHQNGPAPPVSIPVDIMVMSLNIQRVLTDQITL